MRSFSLLALSALALLFVLFLVLQSSCKKEDPFTANIQEIDNYLVANNLTAEKTPEGVYYIITKSTGDISPTISNTVTVHYTGTLLNGSEFDSSVGGAPATFPLRNVIEGWQIGIPKLQKGGEGILIIPSTLAYGANPPSGSGIPSNAVLRFDVQLIDVK